MLETVQEKSDVAASPAIGQEFYTQLNRILTSNTFREAPSSRRLLEYIAARSLEGHEEQLKEFTIAVDVLGRNQDFDPKTDTIVRVQVRRLRQKIEQYYEIEGVQDRVFLTVPKGRYIAEFSLMPPAPPKEVGTGADEVNHNADRPAVSVSGIQQAASASSPENILGPARNGSVPGDWNARLWLVLLVAATLCGAFGEYWIGKRTRSRISNGPISKLWCGMLAGDSSPIIGYPDAVFLLDGSSDLFQFKEGPVGARGELVDPNITLRFAVNPGLATRAGPLYYENGGYTGTGEVESIGRLMILLYDLGFHPIIKRSHDITANDLRTHNVILLGGSAQNKAVKDFQGPGSFDYDYKPADWGGSIVNLHPSSGEPDIYRIEREPASHILTSDYAIVSCLPGIDSSHRIITLGGLDTTGTWGATSYLTSSVGAEEMSRAFHNDFRTPYFESILRVVLKNGHEVFSTHAVAVHSKPTEAN